MPYSEIKPLEKKIVAYLRNKESTEKVKNTLNSRKVRAYKIFKKLKKKSIKKNWSYKKFNFRLLYALAYGNKYTKENIKRVIILSSFYWVKDRKIKNLNEILVFLKLIDFDSNLWILYKNVGSLGLKQMITQKTIKESSKLYFNDVEKDERILKGFCEVVNKNTEKRIL